jgi:inorganic pyrophosphatase
MPKDNLISQLSAGKNPPFEVNCVVEIPKGATNKYEYDEKENIFKLDRALYEAVFYPAEYGFIPQTLNKQDGDPLDVMVLSTFPTFPGCLLPCRPIGVLRLIDSGEEDNKIIAVSANDPRFEEIKELDDLSTHAKKEIKNFFENYAELQTEKKIKIEGWSGKDKAHDLIKEAIKNYQKKKK